MVPPSKATSDPDTPGPAHPPMPTVSPRPPPGPPRATYSATTAPFASWMSADVAYSVPFWKSHHVTPAACLTSDVGNPSAAGRPALREVLGQEVAAYRVGPARGGEEDGAEGEQLEGAEAVADRQLPVDGAAERAARLAVRAEGR